MEKLIAALILTLCLLYPGAAQAERELHFKFGKEQRFAILYTPDNFSQDKTYPVVIVLHGTGESGRRMETMTGFSELGRKEEFITVFPSGTPAIPNNLMTWNAITCCGKGKLREIDDVRFLDMLIQTLVDDHRVDRKRIYLVGQGNGGMMAYRYACKNPDKLAAIAVSGGQAAYRDCEQEDRAVPILHIGGTKDICMPYDGGEKCGACYGPIVSLDVEPFSCLPVMRNMNIWAFQGGCAREPVPGPSQGDVTCQSWKGCRGDTAINLCTVEGGGHNWPGVDNAPPGCRPSVKTNQCRTWRRIIGGMTEEIVATDFIWGYLKGHKIP